MPKHKTKNFKNLVSDMQNVRHNTQNAGHTTQTDGHIMQNVGHTTHNVGHTTHNVCQGPKAGPPTPILEKTLVSKLFLVHSKIKSDKSDPHYPSPPVVIIIIF